MAKPLRFRLITDELTGTGKHDGSGQCLDRFLFNDEERTMTQKTLVEVSVPQADGTALPYGIMNADQAAELCDDRFQKEVAHESSGKEEGQTMFETI